jgi:membrane-bound lytic murein transglycosylase D
MRVDKKRKLDERLSPLKSTIAAARLLKRTRRVLGDWTLAVTSYNHGLKGLFGLSKHLRTKQGMQRVFSLCSDQSPLGWASRNYYSEFLALLHAEAYHDLFFGEMPTAPIAPFAFRKLAKSERLVTVALEAGVSLFELQKLNPDVHDARKPLPKGYWVVMPEGTKQSTSLKDTLAEFGSVRS